MEQEDIDIPNKENKLAAIINLNIKNFVKNNKLFEVMQSDLRRYNRDHQLFEFYYIK